jgi:RNA polymerase sigma-70 factor, ECF subfamily
MRDMHQTFVPGNDAPSGLAFALGIGQPAPRCAPSGGAGKFRGTFVPAQFSYEGDGRTRSALDFESLVELHHAALYRFAVSLTHAESDAGDLVQETFLSWATKGDQLRDSSKAKAWLFTTLHRHFLRIHRRAARFPHLEITEAEAELPSVEPDVVNHLDAAEVVALLARIHPQFRAAVSLFYLEDYSYEEIGTILEIPLGTVKSRIARGLAELKALVFEHASKVNDRERERS